MRVLYTLTLLAMSAGLFSQINLNITGQTPGGAGYHVNWDSTGKKLIVGCGTSVWVYDFSDPAHAKVIARRPFLGLINETSLYGNVLFVAATHDGVYALDYLSPNLDILHHYNMKNMGDSAAYDLWRTHDTLYIADQQKIRILKYNPATGFSKIATFGGNTSYCVARRGDFIVVGNKGTLVSDGNISVYSKNNLSSPVAVWSSPLVNVVQKVRFADLRNDIIYVCAGPENVFFTKSNFIALQFDGNNLIPLDTFTVTGGLPLIAQLNIMNYDSRNDTLFVVTTAACDIHSFPFAYMPIIDATGLPADTLKKIGFVIPGLWHFDAALMHGTPYLAMSSEWCGVLVSDVSQLSPYDTLGLFETGGWCVNAKVKDNLLWACHEGYGLVVYDIDSLYYSAGFHTQSKRMHIYDLNNHYFSTDVEFLNDSLMMINSSEVYNIKPWQAGGQIQLAYDMNKNWMTCMSNIQTNTGHRMVATFDNWQTKKWIQLFNPFDLSGNFPVMAMDSMNCDSRAFCVSGDTVYYGKKIGNEYFLVAQKVVDDAFGFLDSIRLRMILGFWSTDEPHAISVENGIIAVGYGPQFALFRWNGNELQELFTDYKAKQRIRDIVLKNGYAYVADRFYGMKIYDVHSLTHAVLVAQTRGTGGWTNLFGSEGITVADDGKIYLCDFNAGVILIEAFDTSLAARPQIPIPSETEAVQVFPNPSDREITFRFLNPQKEKTELCIYTLQGQLILRMDNITDEYVIINKTSFKPGCYFFRLRKNNGSILTGKFIFQ